MKIERRRIEDLQLDPDNAREHDDANLDFRPPFLIQSLPQAPSFQRNEDKIRSHEGDAP